MGRKSCFLALCSYCECYRGADPYAVTPRSDRSGPRETDPASCRIGLRASPSRPRAPDPGGRPERRRGIVLDAELDGLGEELAARNRPGSDEYIDGKLSAEAASPPNCAAGRKSGAKKRERAGFRHCRAEFDLGNVEAT